MYIGRRNVEGGGRQQQFSQQGYRGVVGLRGAINEVWDYDVSAQYSSGVGNVVTANYFVEDRIERALDVVSVAGVPTCQSVIDGSDPNCVPWNPFTPGGITQAQLDYLQAQGLQIGKLTQEIFNGIVQGDLSGYGVKLPWASDGVQVVFGAEYRSDTLDNDVDALQEAFQLAGSGGPTIGITGSTKVNDLFFEAKVPIAQDRAFAESLSFDTAYRYSDYGSGVQTDTYKLGMEWAPVSDIRFRASYQRAVRAANIVELFTAQGFNLFDLNGDPCGIDAPNANATSAECIASGVPASFYDGVGDLAERGALDSPAGQYNFLAGGNPALAPEESDTQSFGIILTPRFAPGLNMTVDWFNIKVDEAISIFQPSDTLNACYNNNDAAACSRIRRNAIGSLWVGTGNVIATNINIGSLEATGIDVNVGYSEVEIGRFGSLNFSLVGTYFDELIIEPGPGVALYDCVGAYSGACGTPTNEWRHMFRTSWETPWDVDLSVGWRFFSSTTGITDFNPNLPLPANRIDRTAPAESYFDLSANWAVTEKASVVLGINNVLDDNPTLSAGTGTTGNGNTYPQTYDALGRYVFMRATLTF